MLPCKHIQSALACSTRNLVMSLFCPPFVPPFCPPFDPLFNLGQDWDLSPTWLEVIVEALNLC